MKSLATIATVVLMFTGCAPSDDSPTPGAETGAAPPETAPPVAAEADACSLLTAAEVSSILGAEAQPQQDDTTNLDSACTWQAAGAGGTQQAVSIEMGRMDAASTVEQFQTLKNTMEHREDVSGVGDEAFVAGYGQSGSALVLRSDTLLLSLKTTAPGQEAMLKQLAPSVLGRAG